MLLAFSAVLASVGLSELASHVWHASDAASSVILLIGMAVGVDYSLFYVKREREERRRGHGDDAVVRAGATSGNAVLISGATVLIAMAGMLLSGSKIFTSIGISAMLVVASAMVGSLTVLPALLGKLGDRIDRGLLAVLAASARTGPAASSGSNPAVSPGLRRRRTWLQRLKGERETSRLWDGVLAAGSPAPVAVGWNRGLGARRAGAADAVDPHEAARVCRPAAKRSGRAHVLADPEGLSRARPRRR